VYGGYESDCRRVSPPAVPVYHATTLNASQRHSHEPLFSPTAWISLLGIAVLGLIADLASKVWAVDALKATGRSIRFIPGLLHFTYTENHGAVFGIGQGQRWLFLTVSVVAVLFLVWLFIQSGTRRLYQIILGMLLAGVIGNMYDRIVHGYVRDMILALPGWRWPGEWMVPFLNYPSADRLVFPWIFNIADVLLCVGVLLIVTYNLFCMTDSQDRAPGDQASSSEEPVRSPKG
jgi:signal peptidase II